MRVFLYCQSLTGLGHHVRTLEIARALAAAHEVWFTAGSRRFPGDRAAAGVRFVELAPLRRVNGRLAPADPGRALAGVVAERRTALCDAIARIRPDALLIEHFPFGKPELASEVTAAIEAAPAETKVICSLRDIAVRGRYDGETTPGAVCDTLREHFDALLVHGDPAVTRLEEQLPWAEQIPVPVSYTGYVTRRVERIALPGTVVASAGGGADAPDFFDPLLEAWPAIEAYGGPFEQLAGVRGFALDLAGRIAGADLSVSRAGYNTCASILATGARALLVPSPAMTDQRFRARRLAELGVVDTLAPEDASPENLAAAIQRALKRPRPRSDIRLDGAARTRTLVEEIVESPSSCVQTSKNS